MNENTQRKDKSAEKNDQQSNTSNASNWGFAAGGFIAGVAASSAFAMSGTDDVIETELDDPTPAPEENEEIEISTDIETQDEEHSEHQTENQSEPTLETHPDNGLPHYTDAPVAHVSDSQSFAQAFADARQQVGPGGIFEWHGQVYGTYYANEWNSMSQEQRNDYWASVHPNAAHDEVWNPHQNIEPNYGNQQQSNVSEESNLTPSNTTLVDDNDPKSSAEVINVSRTEEGTAVEMRINDNIAVALDVDGDGVVDLVIEDKNGDGVLDENDKATLPPTLTTIADLEEKAGQTNVVEPSVVAQVIETPKQDYNPNGHNEEIADSGSNDDDDDEDGEIAANDDDNDGGVEIAANDDEDNDGGDIYGGDEEFEDNGDVIACDDDSMGDMFDDGMDDMLDDYYNV